MSLNWSLEKIPNYKKVCYKTLRKDYPGYGKKGERRLNPVTNSLIWACMGIGIGEITEENVVEFYCRLVIWDKVHEIKDTPTFEQVKAHIGLNTNVHPKKKDKEFYDTLMIHTAEKKLKNEDHRAFTGRIRASYRK